MRYIQPRRTMKTNLMYVEIKNSKRTMINVYCFFIGHILQAFLLSSITLVKTLN
jgi:hypothetical protein